MTEKVTIEMKILSQSDYDEWVSVADIVSKYDQTRQLYYYPFSSSISLDDWTGNQTYGFEAQITAEDVSLHDITSVGRSDTDESTKQFIDRQYMSITEFRFSQSIFHLLPLHNEDDGEFAEAVIEHAQELSSDVTYQVIVRPAQEYQTQRLALDKLYRVQSYMDVSETYRDRDTTFSGWLQTLYESYVEETYDEDIAWESVADDVEDKIHDKCYQANIRVMVHHDSEQQVEQDTRQITEFIETRSNSDTQSLQGETPQSPKITTSVAFNRSFVDTERIEVRSPKTTPVIVSEATLRSMIIGGGNSDTGGSNNDGNGDTQ